MTHIQQLELPAPEAYRVLTTIRPGEKHHVSCVTETGEMGLSLGCSQIVLEKRRLRVVVVSDINSELSEMQIESWSKLTRILTHEIMNSLAPITSLSDTLLHIDRTMNADVAHGLDTISATSPAADGLRREFPPIHEDPGATEGTLRGAGTAGARHDADRCGRHPASGLDVDRPTR